MKRRLRCSPAGHPPIDIFRWQIDEVQFAIAAVATRWERIGQPRRDGGLMTRGNLRALQVAVIDINKFTKDHCGAQVSVVALRGQPQ